ncbi:lamin tail domain-containing protein 1 [Heteronotia binoei]|uniref:lamin tail domain-containing protein 1 n=1 Tax=Heteronotia binoei TaxID=13085 RepID=UPI002930B16A|nr:lamin tail domain-containing protein 1 [Heteronotia binoei]
MSQTSSFISSFILSLGSISTNHGVILEEAGKSTTIEKLQTEHMNRQLHIKALEERLKEVHDQLQTKLKALDAIQEKNANLQQEIASLKGTLGYIKGMEATHCQLPPTLLQLQQNSECKPTITSKSSENVLYSLFMESHSEANLFPGELSSGLIRFPEKSLSALDKMFAPSCSCVLQNQQLVCRTSSSHETNILGQGLDYITYLFAKVRETPSLWDLVGKTEEKSTAAEYISSSACSAIGNLKIVELHPSGHFVKIINSSPNTEEDIGDYILQQNVNGHPISSYKFPPRIRMKTNSEIKVWTASSKMTHKPPIRFLWEKLDKFILGPHCTTILCNPSGQAVAWYTPINRSRKQTLEGEESVGPFDNLRPCSLRIHKPRGRWELKAHDTAQVTALQNPAEKKKEPEFIIREEKTPPPLYPVQSSWCRSPNSPTHPHYSLERHLVMGNDGSRLCRFQLARPDPDSVQQINIIDRLERKKI